MSQAGRDPRPPAAVVLAAGQGKRLAASPEGPPKVLLQCLGVPLLEHVRRALEALEPGRTVVVTGHDAEAVERWLGSHWPGALPVRQVPQEGTGQALRLALEALGDFEGEVVSVYGDVPQVRAQDLLRLLATHREAGAAASLLTGVVADPGPLGRVVRDASGAFREVVETQDAVQRPEVLALGEFNTGLYVFDAASLRPALADLSRDNAQGEEYATEALNRIAASGARVVALPTPEAGDLLGVNTAEDLARAGSTLRRRILTEHLARGVIVEDPDTTLIEVDVEIAAGARIRPFTHLGRGCRIGAGATVGPFARLRGGTALETGAEVGNFVEVKASRLGPGVKAKHLTYLGDATIGEDANIGCGTITANYDGRRKHATVIGPRARVGSGTIFVAPVTIGEEVVTGGGAVVLEDVEPGCTVVGVPARVVKREPPGARATEGDASVDVAGEGGVR